MNQKLNYIMAFLIVLLVFPLNSNSCEIDNVQNLINFALSEQAKTVPEVDYYLEPPQFGIIKSVVLSNREQISTLPDWRFNIHYLSVTKYALGFYKVLVTLREQYDAMSPDAYTYTLWMLTDFDGDGTLDRFWKDWIIVTEDENSDFNTILIPQWPDGFRKGDWWHPTKEECQVLYDSEIGYWTQFVGDRI